MNIYKIYFNYLTDAIISFKMISITRLILKHPLVN